MTVGLISDTHGYLDLRVPYFFQGVQHILHAGDIGGWHILPELEAIAPVTAVLGNNDQDMDGRDSQLIELEGRKIFIHHIVTPEHPTPWLRERYEEHQPDIVMFGHTHQPYCQKLGSRLFVNPGYAGKPRFNLRRGVALLELGAGEPQVRFVDFK